MFEHREQAARSASRATAAEAQPGKRTLIDMIACEPMSPATRATAASAAPPRPGDASGQAVRPGLQQLFGGPGAGQAPAQPADGAVAGIPGAVRPGLEHAFGIDLSAVRVHHDSAEAGAIGAEAFARGKEIHFAPGRDASDPHLLAHEVAHIAQQAEGGVAATGAAGATALNEDATLELEAERMAGQALAGRAARSGPQLRPIGGSVAQGYFKHNRLRLGANDELVLAARAALEAHGIGDAALALFDRQAKDNKDRGTLAAQLKGVSTVTAALAAYQQAQKAGSEEDYDQDYENEETPEQVDAPKKQDRHHRTQPKPERKATKRKHNNDDHAGDRASANDGNATISTTQSEQAHDDAQRPTKVKRTIGPADGGDVSKQRSRVISGHGRFNETHLKPEGGRSRKKLGTFKLPDDVTLTMYAPPGAGLEDRVGNRIERGESVARDEVRLEFNGGGRKPRELPQDKQYPYVFHAGDDVINYTVSAPSGLTVNGLPFTTKTPKALSDVVAELKQQGFQDLHYACCNAGFSEKGDFEKLFTNRGWSICFQPGIDQ